MNFALSSLIAAILIPLAASASSKRFCCTSPIEYSKCIALKTVNTAFSNFGCVYRPGTEHCIKAIAKSRQADMMFLDGGDIFHYGQSGMIVVAAESYGEEDASYFAVAVVKKNAREDLSMLNLVGAQSCHTGVGKTAGWNIPMGLIARTHGKLEEGRTPLYNPFNASCAPGANSPFYQKLLPNPNKHKQWCELCVGNRAVVNGTRFACDRDADEDYYDYSGAFRCVKDSDGTNRVAFVKHVTVPEAERDNFRLLCRNGSRAHPNDWRTCNLAKVPSHGLIMREDTSDEEAAEVLKQLRTAKEQISESLFMHFVGEKDLLWKSSTLKFLGPIRKTAREFLGRQYFCNMLVVTGSQVESECL